MGAPMSAYALRRRLAAASPLVKLAACVGLIAALGTLIQGGAWLFGFDFNLLWQSKAGRGVLLAITVLSMLALMAADRRRAADYGLVISQNWRRHWFGGILLGIVTYGGYCAIAVACGALTFHSDATAYRWFSATAGAMTALPLAVSQQIIFSGYLLSLFCERYGRVRGVLMLAALFALLTKIGDPASLLTAEPYPLLTGMFIIGALLALLRLNYGTILVPAGLLAGWVFVRRLVRKAHLLAIGDPALAGWFAPSEDPRQSPILWSALVAAIVVFAVVLRRRGDAGIAVRPAFATGVKRYAPLSNFCLLAPLDVWLPRLWQARFAVGPRYLPRLIATLVFSTLNTLLSLPERLLAPLLLAHRRVPDPVFIVGTHRSGTTHLHNLLALDPQFVSPRAYQAMNPSGFLFSGWCLMPILLSVMPWKRPMDGVRFGALTPQEDEWALTGTSGLSPYWGATFPRQYPTYDRFIYPEQMTAAETARWKKRYLRFLQALTFWSGKRPLLKNPYNTARVALLRSMFPQARFIHIYRQPYAVYRSNMHLAAEGLCANYLQDPDPATSYEARFLDNYRRMEDAFYRDAAELSRGDWAEMCFEDLEQRPLNELRRLYAELNLGWTEEVERRLAEYFQDIEGYQKNRFRAMPAALQRRIYTTMQSHFNRWGYRPSGARTQGPADKAA